MDHTIEMASHLKFYAASLYLIILDLLYPSQEEDWYRIVQGIRIIYSKIQEISNDIDCYSDSGPINFDLQEYMVGFHLRSDPMKAHMLKERFLLTVQYSPQKASIEIIRSIELASNPDSSRADRNVAPFSVYFMKFRICYPFFFF